MGLLKLQNFWLVLKVLAFSWFIVVQDAFAVSSLSPPSAVAPALPPRGEEIIGDVSHSQENVTLLTPPIASSPTMSAPGPKLSKGFTPTLQPNDPTSTPPYNSDNPPGALSGVVPVSSPSNSPYQKPQHPDHPILKPDAPVPVGLPTYQSPPSPPASDPSIPLPDPPSVDHNNTPPSVPLSPSYQSPPRLPASQPPIPLSEPPSVDNNNTPPHVPSSPVNEPPPRITPLPSPPVHPVEPVVMPPSLPEPLAPTPSKSQDTFSPPQPTLPTTPSNPSGEHNSPPIPSPNPVPNPGRAGKPVAAPTNGTDSHPLHMNPSSPTQSPDRGNNPGRAAKPVAVPLHGVSNTHPAISPLPSNVPSSHEGKGNISSAPLPPLGRNSSWHPILQPPESVPSTTAQSPPMPRDETTAPVSPVKGVPHYASPKREPEHPRTNTELHASPPWKSEGVESPRPSSVSISPTHQTKVPVKSPEVTHSQSITKFPKMPVQALPPPPPNEDCATLTCSEPFTNGPSGSPCRCILPIQVGLRLGVALYTFFPLVSELAAEISAGDFLDQSQVRIMGANEASQDPEKTVVLTDLVPLGEKFDNITANLIFQRFWHKQVDINTSRFGNYEVLYVRYPGLPPSPPSATSDIDAMDNDPYHNHDNSSRTTKPLGVDVSRIRHNTSPNKGVIAIIVLSASLAVIVFCSLLWVFLLKDRGSLCHPQKNPSASVSSLAKSSGPTASMAGSGPGSASMSLGSSIATYAGSMKTFSSREIERATDNFNEMTVLGEGGFGRVYRGVLDDRTQVAVKVLKRDDHQGGREFLAEVEMLSRLHHRNLVKLIGICTEEHSRCLVYELVPNGSVESSLHGVDEGIAPLDWTARLKIALGAARGLAYLHEDSSPRVIHRDFKASNILLEEDYTPKVSDFGLARAALDENNSHISTRVMGTFGYVAPEYAMTGHLLVKSDVYSYGVVLLELLTGKKPVDMSQPPGQENLVSWTRPFLTSKEDLELIIDQSLGPNFPLDSIAKVAAIASMCVQPEVSNRPFMGEVVQALKLVCNECEETSELGSRSCSREDIAIDMDARTSCNYSECELDPHCSRSYDFRHDVERGLSVSELISSSGRSGRIEHEALRRHSSSGPLRSANTRWPWQNMRRLSGGSISEHHIMYKLWPRNR